MSRGVNLFKQNIPRNGAEEHVRALNEKIRLGQSAYGPGYEYTLGLAQGTTDANVIGLYLFDPHHSTK